MRAQPGFSPWGFAGYGSPSCLCGGGFFRTVRKRGAKRQAFCGRSRVFSLGKVCRAAFAAADFSARGGKGRTAASLLRAQPGIFRGTGSPSCLCGGGFFRTGRKRGAKRQAFCGRSPVFLRGALRVTVRRAAFAAADFFRMGRKRGAKQSAERALALFQRE